MNTLNFPIQVPLTPAAREMLAACVGDGSTSDGLADECDDHRDYEYWLARESHLSSRLEGTQPLEVRDADDVRLVLTAFSTGTFFADYGAWPPHLVASRSKVAYQLQKILMDAFQCQVDLPAEFR